MTNEPVRSLDAIGKSLDTHLRRGAEEWIAAGKDLIEAKKQVTDGWIRWLDAHGLTQETAYKLMRIAKILGRSDQRAALIISRDTLALLVAPSTPAPVRETVLAKVKAGEKVSRDSVRQMIADVKNVTKIPPPPPPPLPPREYWVKGDDGAATPPVATYTPPPVTQKRLLLDVVGATEDLRNLKIEQLDPNSRHLAALRAECERTVQRIDAQSQKKDNVVCLRKI